MATYPAASFQDDIDRLARMREILDAALGSGSETGTISKGASLILAEVLSQVDYEISDALMDAAYDVSEQCKTATSVAGKSKTDVDLLSAFVRALKAEYSNDLDAFLTSEAIKAHPEFNTLYYNIYSSYLSAANVFAPTTEMGRVDMADGAWTFTEGSAISTTYYSPAQLQIYVPATYTIGGVDCVLTITCVKSDDTTENKDATMPADSVAGTTVDVATASDVYKDVSTVTVTGGTNGDRVAIRSKLLRDISAVCA